MYRTTYINLPHYYGCLENSLWKSSRCKATFLAQPDRTTFPGNINTGSDNFLSVYILKMKSMTFSRLLLNEMKKSVYQRN